MVISGRCQWAARLRRDSRTALRKCMLASSSTREYRSTRTAPQTVAIAAGRTRAAPAIPTAATPPSPKTTIETTSTSANAGTRARCRWPKNTTCRRLCARRCSRCRRTRLAATAARLCSPPAHPKSGARWAFCWYPCSWHARTCGGISWPQLAPGGSRSDSRATSPRSHRAVGAELRNGPQGTRFSDAAGGPRTETVAVLRRTGLQRRNAPAGAAPARIRPGRDGRGGNRRRADHEPERRPAPTRSLSLEPVFGNNRRRTLA